MPASQSQRDFSLGIGIDFGTSNSSVALFDGKEVVMIELEAQHDPSDIMPTALYIDRKGSHSIGQPAISSYLKGEAGRTIRLVKESTGEIDITVSGTESSPGSRSDDGAISYTAFTHAFTDQEMKGRLFRSLKRWLGSSSVDSLRVFNERRTIVDLISHILLHMKKRTEVTIGDNLSSAYVGRPVHFEGGSEVANQTALERLQAGCKRAGIGSTITYPEPVAASLSFLQSQTSKKEQTILTFDFGGGTLDLCVLKTKDTAFEILAVHGAAIGGDEIDRLIYRHKVFPELGEGSTMAFEEGTRSARFPFHAFENGLLNWQLTYELNRPELRGEIAQGLRFGGDIEVKLKRLKKLIYNNLSYIVFQAIEHAKIELTQNNTALIKVPEIDLSVKITRSEFETFLTEMLQEIETCVREVLEKAGVTEKEIGMVICTGGSSKIPIVRERLEKIIRQPLVDHRTFTSIAVGLAIASFHKYPSPITS
jgi:hypothetical chaperone protein